MRRAVCSILISTSLLCSSVCAAQASGPSYPSILEAVQNLQASQASQNLGLAEIQKTLPLIQSAITALGVEQTNVRTTPPVYLVRLERRERFIPDYSHFL